MKTSKWTNRIAGFLLGFLVAGVLAFALPRNQASPDMDIYERMTAAEKRLASLEGYNKARAESEAQAQRQQAAIDRMR